MTNQFEALSHPGIRCLKPYQPGKSCDELKREYRVDKIIKLASNENPLGYSESIKKSIEAHLNDFEIYPDSQCHDLKLALANHLSVSPDSLTISSGSDSLIPLLMKCFCLGTNKKVLYSEYSFISYKIYPQILSLSAQEIPSKNWGVNIDGILQQTDEQSGLIFIANPNNPTGTCLTNNQIEKLLANIPATTILVLDEAYYEFGNAMDNDYPKSLELLEKYPNLVITRTFSKAYGLASQRVGYAIAHPGITNLLNRVLPPFSVNSLAQVAAIAALKDQVFIQKSIVMNQQGYQQYIDFFNSEKIDFIPSSANFITMDCGEDSLNMYQSLLERGIIVRPLHPYNMPNHLRITIGLPEQNQCIFNAIKEIRSQ